MRKLGTQESHLSSRDRGEYAYPLGMIGRRQTRHTIQPKQATAAAQACSDRHMIVKRGRYWNVIDPLGVLVCVTVYKCGAREVIRRLESKTVDSSTTR